MGSRKPLSSAFPLLVLFCSAICTVGSSHALRSGPSALDSYARHGRVLTSQAGKALPVSKVSEFRDPATLLDAFVTDTSLPAVQVLWFWGAPEMVAHIGEGETVQWLWWDDKEHSVEGVDEKSRSLFKGKGGGSNGVTEHGFAYNVTFDTPGEYSYKCHFFPELMKGRVIVKPKVNIGGVTIPWYDGVSYGGASAIIEQGDVVTWQWSDELPHSLSMVDGSKDVFSGPGTNGEAMTTSAFSYKARFQKAGTYLYLCAQHGETMRGNITVLPKGSSAVPSA